MALSNDLMSQFAKLTKPDKKEKEKTLYGTLVRRDGTPYVKLDGSEILTPVTSTADAKDGDRVTVLIKNHSAIVNGNVSSPSATTGSVKEIGDKITEVEILMADKVSTIELEAQTARIDELEAKNVTITGELEANKATIGELEAENVKITGELEANKASIEELETKKLDADIADIKYATVENLEATNADIHDLEADYGDFKDLSTDKFEATDAEIEDLKAKKVNVDELEANYANINFSNIGMAAIEAFLAKSGIIADLVVGSGSVTGTLVGVTIKGDLIEGGTVVADKLVIKGTDGLYYKLNTDGETVESEQTEYNSLNGSIITARSITAEKINVNDLVAFDATIGGFNITTDSIHSGVKNSVDNTTRGIYMDDTGQIAIGDANNYIKYYRDKDGSYKLGISASSMVIKIGGKDTTVEEAVGGSVKKTVEEFYQSASPTELSGGSWLKKQPPWVDGRYIFRRTVVTYVDGSVEYTPSEEGVCITGNTGQKGDDAIILQILSSNGNIFKNSALATTLTVTIITGNKMITSSTEMYAEFGQSAALHWEQKLFGEEDFTPVDDNDSRLSDHGFILTLQPDDVYTQTVFNCTLSF